MVAELSVLPFRGTGQSLSLSGHSSAACTVRTVAWGFHSMTARQEPARRSGVFDTHAAC